MTFFLLCDFLRDHQDLFFKSLQKDGTVDSTQACGDGEPDPHIFLSRLIRNIVKVAIRVWKFVIKGGMDHSCFDGKKNRDRLDSSGCSHQMAGDRLSRTD